MDDAFASMEQNKLRKLRDIDRDPPRLIFAELYGRLLKFHLRH